MIMEEYRDPVELMNRKNESHSYKTNWTTVLSNKKLVDAITQIPKSEAPEKLSLDEIVSEKSCLVLASDPNVNFEREPCKIEISLKGKKISRIGIVSEASVLEYFTKWGEYAGTTFAELIDEYEGASVYLAELNYPQPTSEVSIKFTRIDNARSDMYLYGIKLVVEDDCTEEKPNMFKNGFDMSHAEIDPCLTYFMNKVFSEQRSSKLKKYQTPLVATEQPTIEINKNEVNKEQQSSIESYIDKKFLEMEERLLGRIKEFEVKTNEKLDTIIKHLVSHRINN